jgi:hypothetical protein
MDIVTVAPTVTYTVDWARLATELERCVIKRMKFDLKKYSEACAPMSRRLAVRNCSAGLEVCEHISDGQWGLAKQKLNSMASIPSAVIYDMIDEVAGEVFWDAVKG